MAAVVTYISVNYLGMTTKLWIPFLGTMIDLGVLYYALVSLFWSGPRMP